MGKRDKRRGPGTNYKPKIAKPPPLCAFCGIRIGTRRGHVIPRGFFKVLPKENATVPACPECENGTGDGGPRPISQDEEYVRNVLCMSADAEQHDDAQHVFSDAVVKSFRNSPALLHASVMKTA